MEQAREALKKLNVFVQMRPGRGAGLPLIPANSGGGNTNPVKCRGLYKNVAFVSHPRIVG
jgi:hypothetical protein